MSYPDQKLAEKKTELFNFLERSEEKMASITAKIESGFSEKLKPIQERISLLEKDIERASDIQVQFAKEFIVARHTQIELYDGYFYENKAKLLSLLDKDYGALIENIASSIEEATKFIEEQKAYIKELKNDKKLAIDAIDTLVKDYEVLLEKKDQAIQKMIDETESRFSFGGSSVEKVNFLASAYYFIGDYKKGLRFFEQLLEKQPVSLAILKAALFMCVKSGSWDKAYTIAEKLLNLEENELNLKLLVATCLLDQRTKNQAKKINKINFPKELTYKKYNALGLIELEKKRFKKALHFFEKSNSIRVNSHAYNCIGYTHFLEKDYDKALEMIERSIALDPLNFVGYDYKAVCNIMKGDYEQGLKNLSIAHQLRPDSETVLLNIAKTFKVFGWSESSIDVLQVLLRYDPLNLTAWNNLAVHYAEAKKYAEADKALHMRNKISERRKEKERREQFEEKLSSAKKAKNS